jgi:hypothetical protein
MHGSPRADSLGWSRGEPGYKSVFDCEWHTSAASYHQVPVPLIENQ